MNHLGIAFAGAVAQLLKTPNRPSQLWTARNDQLAQPDERGIVACGKCSAGLDHGQGLNEAAKEGQFVVLDALDEGTKRARAPMDGGNDLGEPAVEVVWPGGLGVEVAALDVLEDL